MDPKHQKNKKSKNRKRKKNHNGKKLGFLKSDVSFDFLGSHEKKDRQNKKNKGPQQKKTNYPIVLPQDYHSKTIKRKKKKREEKQTPFFFSFSSDDMVVDLRKPTSPPPKKKRQTKKTAKHSQKRQNKIRFCLIDFFIFWINLFLHKLLPFQVHFQHQVVQPLLSFLSQKQSCPPEATKWLIQSQF